MVPVLIYAQSSSLAGSHTRRRLMQAATRFSASVLSEAVAASLARCSALTAWHRADAAESELELPVEEGIVAASFLYENLSFLARTE